MAAAGTAKLLAVGKIVSERRSPPHPNSHGCVWPFRVQSLIETLLHYSPTTMSRHVCRQRQASEKTEDISSMSTLPC
jgi:hypothetical protein